MAHLKHVALRMFITFAITAVLTVGGYFIALNILLPEETKFPDNTPPFYFPIVVEQRETSPKSFNIVQWHNVNDELQHPSRSLQLSVKSYQWPESSDDFKVVESTESAQVIELSTTDTAIVKIRYRVVGNAVTPLSYKVDGSMGLMLVAIGIFLCALLAALSLSRLLAHRLAPKWG